VTAAGYSVAPGGRSGRRCLMTSSDASEPVPTHWTKATVYRDMWVDPDDDPRETDVEAVDERGILLWAGTGSRSR
jgi:hypothetical protein